MSNKITIGILAHVDAGKTTLSEGLLYHTGQIRTLGRVDKKNAFLDNNALERERGITIFSKQAVFSTEHNNFYLLDTPGHVDFSAEMERTLQVLDYAILVISGSEGVQSHTMTLWKLLQRYQVPTFLFVNKMDLYQPLQETANLSEQEKLVLGQKELIQSMRVSLDHNLVNFSMDHESEEFLEGIAMCDEHILDAYLEEGEIAEQSIRDLIAVRQLFPVYFGSALKLDGVEEFLKGLDSFVEEPTRKSEFAARVFKVSRDNTGNRLTFVKITGGALKTRTLITGNFPRVLQQDHEEEEQEWSEKINQIRVYNGDKYEPLEIAEAGTVCALTGLNYTYPGQGFGAEKTGIDPMLEPVLTYQIIPPADCDEVQLLKKLRTLEEETPELHVIWDEQVKEIHVQVMGEVQIEILKRLILERFGLQVEFDSGSIVYKETIRNTVEGVGHFEPLRHYAETHLLLEPGEPGSGITVETNCSEDLLAKNWQRLITTHLLEKIHRGVLIGAPITDIKITLIAGRAHLKHTMGGDFRQATYRAVRQGLMKAESVILEPWYSFRMELPMELIGRAMTDIQAMYGTVGQPEMEGELYVLQGYAPVSTFQNYQKELNTYSHGKGHVMCMLDGYRPCHNQEEIWNASNYDPELDLRNTPHSVFCTHGAGFVVPWNEVESYMHVDGTGKRLDLEGDDAYTDSYSSGEAGGYEGYADEAELKAIFEKTYGIGSGSKKKTYGRARGKKLDYADYSAASSYKGLSKPKKQGKDYLLVDGYNIIHAWPELRELADKDFNASRMKLMDILSNYQGYVGCILILVFDAYKVKGGQGSVTRYHNIDVVYTREAETADMYIEKTAHQYGKTDKVTVATSDGLEQVIIRGQGCLLLSASELAKEIEYVNAQIRETVDQHKQAPHQMDSEKAYLHDVLDEVGKNELQQLSEQTLKEK